MTSTVDSAVCSPRQRVIIAGDFGFPNGTGATVRVHAYAQGLSATGTDVQIVCLRPSEADANSALNHTVEGRYRGIPFVYSGGSAHRDRTFAHRRARDLRSIGRFLGMVRGSGREKPANVILYSNSGLWILTAVLACRVAGSVCVIDRSEFPFINARDTLLMKLWAWLFTRTAYRLVDGVIVISTFLEEYFAKRVRRGQRVIRIPVLVNMSDFPMEREAKERSRRTLCYAGVLDHPGEVPSLLDAFGAIHQSFPEWDLRVIGGARDPSAVTALRDRVAKQGLTDRVEFTGAVGRDRLLRLFRDADGFALPRADGLFSTAGFPTKLGEYLASGKPVVVTATGDIPLYLRDGVNAFLVPSGDTRAFSARLAQVFSDSAAARAVGLRGRETARQYFEAKSQCRRLLDFLNGLDRVQTAGAADVQ